MDTTSAPQPVDLSSVELGMSVKGGEGAISRSQLNDGYGADFVEEVACGRDTLLIHFSQRIGSHAMMGERRVMQEALFYGFSLERRVPDNHLRRKIDRFVDLSEVRAHLEPYYSEVGRPSIDSELMIRMAHCRLLLCVRSERRLCDEAHLNLAYRWFCRLGRDGDVPDHSFLEESPRPFSRERSSAQAVPYCFSPGRAGGIRGSLTIPMITSCRWSGQS
jgi:transposase